jgi:hypothetical protein
MKKLFPALEYPLSALAPVVARVRCKCGRTAVHGLPFESEGLTERFEV